ncbi:MAG: hypothetical protein Q9188_003583 [Gyalolechia gomerana]
MEDDNRISITVCGDGGCGKSSITLRLVRSQWTHEYDPTIEDSYSVTRKIDGRDYYLSLTDTAGQEEYRGLWAASNLRSDAFLLVYDITSASSLADLNYFLNMINMECEHRMDSGGIQPVKFVVGNKCDLKEGRVLSSRQGLEWARGEGCGFMETSAREKVNIEETFERKFGLCWSFRLGSPEAHGLMTVHALMKWCLVIVRRVVAARREHALAANTPPDKRFANPFKQHAPASNTPQTSSMNPLNEKTNQGASFAPTLVRKPKSTGFWAKLKCW